MFLSGVKVLHFEPQNLHTWCSVLVPLHNSAVTDLTFQPDLKQRTISPSSIGIAQIINLTTSLRPEFIEEAKSKLSEKVIELQNMEVSSEGVL